MRAECLKHGYLYEHGPECPDCVLERKNLRILELELAFNRLLTQLTNNTKIAAKMFDEIIEAKQVLESTDHNEQVSNG